MRRFCLVSFLIGLALGMAWALVSHGFLDCGREDDFQSEAIEAGCGHYDAKTGEFTWGAP